MSDSEFPNNDYDSVIINGSWCSGGSGWDGWCLTLTDDNNDNVYEGNVDLNNGDYEYVVVVSGEADNWSGWDKLLMLLHQVHVILMLMIHIIIMVLQLEIII
tara:strand:- start:79 stop:384 length:306 start_codon:yes stop_codon:yes gene_type:complete